MPVRPRRAAYELDRHAGADTFPQNIDDGVRNSGDEAGDDLVGIRSAECGFLDAERDAGRGRLCRRAADAP
jgi:hypothetical protein